MLGVAGARPMEREPDLANLLLKDGVIEAKDVEFAKKVQSRLEEFKSFGEVLIGLRLITRSRLNEYLKENKSSMGLGDWLMEKGLITISQYEKANAALAETPEARFEDMLVEKGYINKHDLIESICELKDIPFIEPNSAMLDPAVVSRVSINYLSKNHLIPLSIDEGKIRVIAPGIPDKEVVKMIEGIYAMPAVFAIAHQEKIAEVLAEYQGKVSDEAYAKVLSDPTKKITDIVDFIILEASRLNASDVHIEPLPNKVRIRYRLDGVLVHRTDLPKEMQSRIAARIKIMAEMDITEHRRHQDGRIQIEIDGEMIDLRVSTYITVDGENIVMRILNKKMGLVALEELGMPPNLLSKYYDFVLRVPAGVVVITGPTGSGKTTTLYSSIDYCNEMGVKIITAEDPVEYQIEGIMQCSIDNHIGRTFEDTLKAIVRQDPDIIVLGEIRDRDTAETAIQAALTGHKVFTTFHTEDSVGGILRLMNMEIEAFMISSTVICIVAQRLVRKICPHCKEEKAPTFKELFLLEVEPEDLAPYTIFKGKGCDKCFNTGYIGRTAIYEILILDEQVKEAILERKTSSHIRKLCIKSSGLVTLQESGLAKVVQGATTLEEILKKAPVTIKPRSISEILQIIGEDN